MKDNILGITLLTLLFVGSSDVLAATEEEQKEAAVVSAMQCSAVYKAYGATSNYDASVYEAGVQLRENATVLADHIGMDFFTLAQIETTSKQQANEMVQKTGFIPPQIDGFCTGVYKGSTDAVSRVQ